MTDSTFNPWRGCANCYAEAGSKRNPAVLGKWGPNGTRVLASEAKWREPLAWDRKAAAEGRTHRVFCASLADVFEDWPGAMSNARGKQILADTDDGRYTLNDARAHLWRLIEATPHLTWQLVTKRPENAVRMVPESWRERWPDNVWLLASVENQAAADERVPHLLRVPARVRGLSLEPLLGPVDVRGPLGLLARASPFPDSAGNVDMPGGSLLDWLILGGESGHGARPCMIEWVRSLVRQGREAGCAVFVKQLGAHAVGTSWSPFERRKLSDPKGGSPEEWPADLRVREFPA